MRKYLYLPIIILGSFMVFGVYAAIQYMSGSYGTLLPDGVFRSDGSGNAGQVDLLSVGVDDDALVGSFWMQTVGTGTFHTDARIMYTGTGNPTTDCWSVIGSASSQNAGPIEITGSNTALQFNPTTRSLEGYGWSENLGRIPFGIGDCDSGLVAGGAFIGRVKVIGNMGGSQTLFSTFFDDRSAAFDASLFNSTLQKIRKNVGIMTRNLSSIQKNETLITKNVVGESLFYVYSGSTEQQILYSDIADVYATSSIRSLIIIGGDISIDQDIMNSFAFPKGIIVLKNENGVGGNAYIQENVRRIQSTIFVEGTLYSGVDRTDIYNDTTLEVTSLPETQLYIQGSIISRNTIGGASISDSQVACPYNSGCTYEIAIRYDLNYFRNFDRDPSRRAYMYNGVYDDRYDDYSLIIEYDSRVISSPPPGLQ